jgi:replication factor A1
MIGKTAKIFAGSSAHHYGFNKGYNSLYKVPPPKIEDLNHFKIFHICFRVYRLTNKT